MSTVNPNELPLISGGDSTFHVSEVVLPPYYKFLMESQLELESGPYDYTSNTAKLIDVQCQMLESYEMYPEQVSYLVQYHIDTLSAGLLLDLITLHSDIITAIVNKSSVLTLSSYVEDLITTTSRKYDLYPDVALSDESLVRSIYAKPRELTIQQSDDYLEYVNSSTVQSIIDLNKQYVLAGSAYRSTTCPELIIAHQATLVQSIKELFNSWTIAKLVVANKLFQYRAESWYVCMNVMMDKVLDSSGSWLDKLDQIVDSIRDTLQNSTVHPSVPQEDNPKSPEVIANLKELTDVLDTGRVYDNLNKIEVELVNNTKGTEGQILVIDAISNDMDRLIPEDNNWNSDSLELLESRIVDANTYTSNLLSSGASASDAMTTVQNSTLDVVNSNISYEYDNKPVLIDRMNNSQVAYNEYLDSISGLSSSYDSMYNKMTSAANGYKSPSNLNYDANNYYKLRSIMDLVNLVSCSIKSIACLVLSVLSNIAKLLSKIAKLSLSMNDLKEIYNKVENLVSVTLSDWLDKLINLFKGKYSSDRHIAEATAEIRAILGDDKADQFMVAATNTMDAYWATYNSTDIVGLLTDLLGPLVNTLVNSVKSYVDSIYGLADTKNCSINPLKFDLSLRRDFSLGNPLRRPSLVLGIKFPLC